MNKLKVVELFAGIGAWSKALENLNIEHETVLAVENDQKTIEGYNYIHNTNFEPIDITQLNEKLVPDCDMICYSPPCQAFSLAGNQQGFNDHRGILFFDALRIIKEKKPKYAIMENVKGLITNKFINEFKVMLKELEKAGYTNYWKVLNPFEYGFPQSRERVFIVSIRNDLIQDFKFPNKKDCEFTFSSLLETDIHIIKKNIHTNKAIEYLNRKTHDGRDHWDFGQHNDTDKPNSVCITRNIHKGVPYNVLIDRRFNEIYIRKHTSKECLKLMGFTDQDFNNLKIHKVSDTQIFKMAGNSIVVYICELIFKNIFNIK